MSPPPVPPDRGARESRDGRRFKARRPLPAQFLTLSVAIQNLSGSGVQIEHSEPVNLGSCGTLRIDAALAGETMTFPARSVWSHLSQNVDRSGKFRYRSGLLLIDPSASSLGALGRLIHSFGAPDGGSLEHKRQATATTQTQAAALRPVAPEQLEQIRAARVYLQVHLEDAQNWYNRAKFSFASAGYGDFALPYRDEVLAIWEYTGRTISLSTIVQALEDLH